jgi:hypothetical protein
LVLGIATYEPRKRKKTRKKRKKKARCQEEEVGKR